MTFRFVARGGLALALAGLSFMTLACGNASVPKPSIKGSRTDADSKAGLATKPKPQFDAQAQMLAEQLELDLVSQGVSAADARAIALGALDGSRSEVSAGEGQAIGLIDLSGFLPGFLKGALGVAKTVFAGSPIGIAGSIVESIVKGFSKTPGAPTNVLSTLPAIALETLLKGGIQGNGNSGGAPKGNTIQDMLAALLASGRGIAAVPQAGSDAVGAGADLSKQMMEQLVAC